MTTRLLVLRLLAISSALVLGACKDDVGEDVNNTPDAFSFPAQNDVALNSTRTTPPVEITGINSAKISVSGGGGTYAVSNAPPVTTPPTPPACGSTFVNTPGIVANGQFVCVRHNSSRKILSDRTTTLIIGTASADFVSKTADVQPDPFTFTAQTDVPPNTTRTSNTVTITGITGSGVTPISVTGGSYSIGCTATFVTAAGTINNNQTVCVRHTSSAAVATAVNTVLTIGTAPIPGGTPPDGGVDHRVSDTFTSTTVATAPDTTPDAFTFTDRTNVGQNLQQVSNTVTITGITAATPISVTGGEYGIGCTAFTNANGTISNNQTVCVRHTSANLPATAVNTALTVGGVSDTFTTTTAAAAPDYAGFVFGVTAGTSPRLVQFAANAPGIIANGANGVAITGLTGTPTILGIDFRPPTGALHALASDGALYTVDTTTGAAISLCTLAADTSDTTSPFTALSGAAFGVDFNPATADRLRIVSNTGQNLRVNVTNCTTITDDPINPGTPQLVGAGYTNSVSGPTQASTTLFVVDTVNDSLATQNPPNNGTLVPVGPLGTTVNSLTGFDIVRVGATDHVGLLSVDGAANSTLFRVNLLSGQASSAGVIGGGAIVTDIAIPIP